MIGLLIYIQNFVMSRHTLMQRCQSYDKTANMYGQFFGIQVCIKAEVKVIIEVLICMVNVVVSRQILKAEMSGLW